MKRFTLFILIALPCTLFLGCSYLSRPSAPATATEKIAAPAEVSPQQTEVVVVTAEPPAPEPQLFEPGDFESPERCLNCHREIYNDWSKSMHAYAWKDKWYQPDYLLASSETNGATDVFCGACHAPIAARTGLLPPADGSMFDATSKRGISCDFCHTVTRIEQMYNMGQISAPGNTKIGPRGDGRSLYHEVTTTNLHAKADFCGACHMVINPANGTRIIDTWEDWKGTSYAEKNITCQNCHMTPTPGVSKAPGRASLMGKPRDNIAFHGFIGGSSYLQDAIGHSEQAEMSREFLRAAAEVKLTEKITADNTLELQVDVLNVGAGHKIPTGTTYIRIIWLQLEVTDQTGKRVYSSGLVDEKNYVDPNAVFFRVLFRDADGNLTDKSWHAQSIGYDRRIPANGMDSETYRIPLPGRGDYQVMTRLMYRSFTQETLDEVVQRTGIALPPVESVEMASARIRVVL